MQPDGTPTNNFDAATGELRKALIRGIAHRVGKTVDHISIDEACSDIPLAELYQLKLRTQRHGGIIERLLSRLWWR
jgi:hypothetical protein